ncbi:MAG: EF-P beta-lysylation protein EpmB [Candidatus Endobugula sp.]|jgi:EF-P beta-lysylation protein EpmB
MLKTIMIHRTAAAWQDITNKEQQLISSDRNTPADETLGSWQLQLQHAVSDPAQLLSLLALDTAYLEAAQRSAVLFPLRVPLAFIARMKKGDINDPLLQQVLPVDAECEVTDGYSTDPVEEQSGHINGLIHKYHGRVLLMVNGHCAINCRYCFRRHFPYDEHKLSREQWTDVLQHIRDDHSISEVIYSGGDPLASNDKQLRWLTEKIADIPHIKRLRIHSRLPIVIPSRINDACIQWMSETRLKVVMVLHSNHGNELADFTLKTAVQRMKSVGITVLNQAVLLKGINDDVISQVQLSEDLFEMGVLPYYLHVLDKVQGSAHFAISDLTAKQLHAKITAQLPGYLVPKLVREISDEPSKVLI